MCNNNNTKIFRSIIKPLIANQNFFNFSLDLPSQPATYIELIGYGIHEKASNNLYILNFSGLFDNPILCHSGADQTFMNFSHGIIFSVDQKPLNGQFTCYINPIDSNVNIGVSTINLYFVIHY